MSSDASVPNRSAQAGTPLSAHALPLIPVIPLGMSLGVFFGLTFVLCVAFDLLFPEMAMNPVWAPLLPGFAWISWSSFLLGLVESIAYGWYIALVFAPLYNFFVMRTNVSPR